MSQRYLMEFNMDVFYLAELNPEEFVAALLAEINSQGDEKRSPLSNTFGISYKYHRHHSDESPFDIFKKAPQEEWWKFEKKINRIAAKRSE